jgi:hypothetical protein
MDQLKKILKEKPHVDHVYLNEKGEWLFHQHPNFPNKISREEVMAMKNPTEEVESNTSTVPVFMQPGTVVDPLLKEGEKHTKAEEKAEEKKTEAIDNANAKAAAEINKIEAKQNKSTK